MTTSPSRRAFISTAPVALAGLGATAAAAGSSELHRLIDAHRTAAADFYRAMDELAAAEKRHEELHAGKVYLAPASFLAKGGLDMEIYSFGQCRENVVYEYKQHRQNLRVIGRVSPEASKQAIAVLDVQEQEDLARIDAAFEEKAEREKASGLSAARDRYHATGGAADDAAADLCRYRCTTLEEARARALYYEESGLAENDLGPEFARMILQSFLAEKDFDTVERQEI